MIISTAVFTLGSGLCGGANTIEMLVAGRLVQGVGAGAINVLIEIIVCDLLPLRERGKYLGIMFGAIALGTVMGPLFGGLIVQHSSWYVYDRQGLLHNCHLSATDVYAGDGSFTSTFQSVELLWWF